MFRHLTACLILKRELLLSLIHIYYATEKSAYVANIRGYNYGDLSDEELVKKSILPYGGVFNETSYEQRTSLIRNNLSYKAVFAEGLSFDAMLGQEFRTTKYNGLLTNAYG